VITDGEMRRVSWITTIPIVALRLHEAPLGGFTYRVPDQPSWFAFWRNDAGEVVQRSGLPRAFITLARRRAATRTCSSPPNPPAPR
jgi:hypothetical protein